MSRLVQQLIGAAVEPVLPAHPLAELVEGQLKSGRFSRQVGQFLGRLPERPELDSVHVVSISETHALCRGRSRMKDHESPRYFDTEVSFQVDLTTGSCRVMPS